MLITDVQSVARIPPECFLRSKIWVIGTLKDHSANHSWWEPLWRWSIARKPLRIGLCGHKSALAYCTRCICSRKKFCNWFTDMISSSKCLWAVFPSGRIATLTSPCDVGDLVTWRKKQLLWLSQPLECLKGQSNSEWCFHFNCSRGYQSASMCHLLFVPCFCSMFNSQTPQLEPFEPFCPNHSFISNL